MHKRSSILSWRKNTTVIVTVGFTLVLIALVISYVLDHFKPTTQLSIGGAGFYNVRVADTEGKRIKGLSGVEKLAINEGLLMVFEADGDHGIWMKDMRMPIDVVWLDKDKKVTYMRASLSPDSGTRETFKAPQPTTRYIVELPEGAIKINAIRKGSAAQFQLEEKK